MLGKLLFANSMIKITFAIFTFDSLCILPKEYTEFVTHSVCLHKFVIIMISEVLFFNFARHLKQIFIELLFLK